MTTFGSLPFVFAAWVVSSKSVSADFINQFNKILGHGINNISLAIQSHTSKLPGKNFDPANYLMQRIDYHLNDDKKKALDLFLKKMKRLAQQNPSQ